MGVGVGKGNYLNARKIRYKKYDPQKYLPSGGWELLDTMMQKFSEMSEGTERGATQTQMLKLCVQTSTL